ncbi:MAG: DNA-deoxyinosine glycosylase [Selenomonadaceae bacterium]|nr:DNA-deoxyinosine glycosylase [Selenomonadaceae bacterium]
MNKSSSHCIGFTPSIDKDCTHLILGSMPSIASLSAQQYYAHPQNRFWPLMARILENLPAPPASYEERLAMLLRHHIALWDSIGTCDRAGSLDSDIKNEQGNDFAALLEKYPKIHTICFNGGKSFQCFKKYNKALLERPDLLFHKMPSTSPANARWKLEMLEMEWGKGLR